VIFPSTFHLRTVGMGFEVLTVVLEEHLGSVYTGHQMMEAVGSG
jgi:hypothetical protein